jgi:hypothetical protein
MSNFILDNTASDINTALGKVLNPDTSPTDTDSLITSGGVKAYVDTEITNNPATAALTTEVAELSEDFYKETFSISGTVNSSTTLATFTAPEDGLYIGLLVGTYSYPYRIFQSITLYWENQGEVLSGNPNGWVQVNPVLGNGTTINTRFAFTRAPVALLQGQTIKLRTHDIGTRTATYDLTFKLSRLA